MYYLLMIRLESGVYGLQVNGEWIPINKKKPELFTRGEAQREFLAQISQSFKLGRCIIVVLRAKSKSMWLRAEID